MAESCDKNQKHPVLAVVGPTATGKTALGVALAEAFEGEVISADSMQIYKGLDVGTAKVAPDETHGIPHHAVDILEPDEPFSVADFVTLAGKLEADISARGRLPILVGGTGPMSRAFVRCPLRRRKTPDGLQEQLAWEECGKRPEAMYRAAGCRPGKPPPPSIKQSGAGPAGAGTFRATGKRQAGKGPVPPRAAIVRWCWGWTFLTAPSSTAASTCGWTRCWTSASSMRQSWSTDHRQTYRTAAQAIGYKEFFSHFEGTATLDACTEKLKQASRNYAKRQLTWFRHMDGVVWLDASAPDVTARAVQLTQEFLAKG